LKNRWIQNTNFSHAVWEPSCRHRFVRVDAAIFHQGVGSRLAAGLFIPPVQKVFPSKT